MSPIFFRVKSVITVGLPCRPQIEVIVGTTPLRIERKRVENHVNYLKQLEPKSEHRLQEVTYA